MISWNQTMNEAKGQRKFIPASLFTPSEDYGFEDIPFQLAISEEHGLEFRISDHTIQDGSTISDHVTQELRRLTVKGMFTNRPLSGRNGTTSVGDDGSIVVEGTKAVTNTALENYMKLEALAKKREPVRIVTSMMTYPKMIITSLKTTRDEKSGDSVQFVIELREVVTVSLKEIRDTYTYDPDTMETANKRLIANKKNAGKVSAEQKEADKLHELSDQEMIK